MTHPSFAIVTALLNEHDFLNYFVEYYVNLGFQKVYCLVDNSTTEQKPYLLKHDLVDYVMFIHVTDLFKKFEIVDMLLSCNHKSDFIHKSIQNVFQLFVVEDYCLLAGVDSFLHLQGLTVQNFFAQNKIEQDVGMIFFPWFSCVNNKTIEQEYNLVNIIDQSSCLKYVSDHFVTIGKKNLVLCPSDDSHYYKIENPVKCWYNKQVAIVKPHHSFHNISNDLFKIKSCCNQPCVIHFMIRSVVDCLLKYYYQWSLPFSDDKEQKIKNLFEIIVNKTKDQTFYEKKLHYLTYSSSLSCQPNIKTNYNDFQIKENELLLKTMLKQCNISYLEYINWCLHCGYI
jgi:hypothetical protein